MCQFLNCDICVSCVIAIDTIPSAGIVVSMPQYNPQDIDGLLPLPPATFHILIALAESELHGYAIIQDIEQRTNGSLRLSAGTLYRSIQRMLEQGLVEELRDRERPAPELDDERRRYYRITMFGKAVARAEAQRLTDLVRLARESGLAPRRS